MKAETETSELLELTDAHPGLFREIDPRLKLVAAALGVIASVMAPTALPPFLLGLICVVILIGGGAPLRRIILRLLAPLPVVGVLILLQAFLSGTTTLYQLHLFGRAFSIKAEGLKQGACLASRVFGATAFVMLPTLTTSVPALFEGLRRLKIPAVWLEMTYLTYRYFFKFGKLAAGIRQAQLLRGGYNNLRVGLRSFGILVGNVLIGAFDQAGKTALGMELRGYEGQLKFIGRLHWKPRDTVWLIIISLLFISYAAIIGGGLL